METVVGSLTLVPSPPLLLLLLLLGVLSARQLSREGAARCWPGKSSLVMAVILMVMVLVIMLVRYWEGGSIDYRRGG